MKIINWSANYDSGYGDLLSPLCYAYNLSEINQETITLRFNWLYTKKKNAFNYPDYKINFLCKKFNIKNILIEHFYEQSENHKNINDTLKYVGALNPMHNVWFPISYSNITPKYNVVCSNINNLQTFNFYASGLRKWKETLSVEQWKDLIEQPNTIHIDYRTPISEAVDILYNCKFFIGYHGSCSWLARFLGLPMKILSNNEQLTRFSFPWSLEQDEPIDYDKALFKMNECRKQRDEYINNLRIQVSNV